MAAMESNRKAYIDVVAGIMIIWMILGHCNLFSRYCPRIIENTYKLLSFYMPWFFYKSGTFFSNKEQTDLLKKDAGKYLRYFGVYSLVGWLVWSILGLINGSLLPIDCFLRPIHSFLKGGNISGNGALWFLLSLFFVRQIGNFVVNVKPQVNKRFMLFVAAIISLAIAFLLYELEWYNHSYWFGNIFTGLFFFLLGYLFKNIERNKIVFLISTTIYALFVIAYFTGVIRNFPYLYMHANRMYYGNYLFFFPMAVAGIIMTNNIFGFLCDRMRFRILEYIGRNSMNFYVTHWILFTVVVFVTKYIFHVESPKYLFYILLMSSIVFLPLISNLINMVKAKSKFFNKIL